MTNRALDWVAEHRNGVRNLIWAIAFATAMLSGSIWYLDLDDNLFRILLTVLAVEVAFGFLAAVTGQANENVKTVAFITKRAAVEVELDSAWELYEHLYLPGLYPEAEALKRGILAETVSLTPNQTRVVHAVLERWAAADDEFMGKDLSRLSAALADELSLQRPASETPSMAARDRQ